MLLLCDVLLPISLKEGVYLGIVSREAVTKRKAYQLVLVDNAYQLATGIQANGCLMNSQLLQDRPQRDHVGLVGEVIFPNLTLGCWAKTQEISGSCTGESHVL